MKTFSHDVYGNIILDPSKMSKDGEALRDILYAKCKVIKGELAYNTHIGIPLTTNKDAIDVAIIETISNTNGVVRIIKMSSIITKDKQYYAEVDILSIYGDISIVV